MNEKHERDPHAAPLTGQKPHEVTPSNYGKTAGSGPEHAVTSESFLGIPPVVRFTVDGVVKSLQKPVTGADLYRVAGQPKSLSVGGRSIENNSDPVEIEDGAEATLTR
jgi:hypothetical protein